jgi:hypothetical protein
MPGSRSQRIHSETVTTPTTNQYHGAVFATNPIKSNFLDYLNKKEDIKLC